MFSGPVGVQPAAQSRSAPSVSPSQSLRRTVLIITVDKAITVIVKRVRAQRLSGRWICIASVALSVDIGAIANATSKRAKSTRIHANLWRSTRSTHYVTANATVSGGHTGFSVGTRWLKSYYEVFVRRAVAVVISIITRLIVSIRIYLVWRFTERHTS